MKHELQTHMVQEMNELNQRMVDNLIPFPFQRAVAVIQALDERLIDETNAMINSQNSLVQGS